MWEKERETETDQDGDKERSLHISLYLYYREIKILKKLRHRNVIKLIDMFTDDSKQKLYIVLEYCVGGLQEMLDKAPRNRFPIWQAHK